MFWSIIVSTFDKTIIEPGVGTIFVQLPYLPGYASRPLAASKEINLGVLFLNDCAEIYSNNGFCGNIYYFQKKWFVFLKNIFKTTKLTNKTASFERARHCSVRPSRSGWKADVIPIIEQYYQPDAINKVTWACPFLWGDSDTVQSSI